MVWPRCYRDRKYKGIKDIIIIIIIIIAIIIIIINTVAIFILNTD